MRVIPIGSKLFLGGRYARGGGAAAEDVKFFVAAAAVILAPPLLFCAVIGRLWPLWLMACDAAAGCALGCALFKRSSHGLPACVPRTAAAMSRPAAHAGGMKKVA